FRARRGRAAAGVRRPVRSLSARQGRARPSRRDAAVPAVAVRQPRKALRHQARKAAVAIHQGEHRGDDVGHVLGRAAQLHDQRARGRPGDVRGRLSVRAGRRGWALHGYGAAVRQGARRHLRQQRDATAGVGVTTRILILEKDADAYARALAAEFSGIDIHTAATAADISVELAAVDVLLAYGIAINDRLMADAKSLKWIASLATGVDHFLRCPHLRRETILTSARGIHGPSMRETTAWLILAVSRGAQRLVHAKDAHRW